LYWRAAATLIPAGNPARDTNRRKQALEESPLAPIGVI